MKMLSLTLIDYQLSFCYWYEKLKLKLGVLVAQFLLYKKLKPNLGGLVAQLQLPIWKINPQPLWIIDWVPVSDNEALQHTVLFLSRT